MTSRSVLLASLIAFTLSSCIHTDSRESANFDTFVANAYLNTNSNDIVKCIVFRWSVDFIHALSDERARKEHWVDSTRTSYEQALIDEHYGSLGDSTTFLVSLHNEQFPCQSPVLVTQSGMHALIPQSMMMCDDIDISDIHTRIYIENEKHFKLRPLFVANRRHTSLTTDELLFVKFVVGVDSSYNFIAASRELFFVADIEKHAIRLRIK